MRLCVLIAAWAALLLPRQPQLPAAPVDLPELMIRASNWAARFDQSLSGLLFRERYTQRVSGMSRAPATARNRDLEANVFLLRVSPGRDFVVYRDVYRVNSLGVANHTERLAKLLSDGSASGREQARRLTDASAQYNVPGFKRNINVPTMAYDFLAPGHVGKIRVRHAGTDRIKGLDIVVIDFEEFGRPTLVRGAGGADVPATGRFWIHADSGAVPRALIRFEVPDSKGRIEVELELHETLKVWVPKEMTEVWTGAGARRLTGLAHYDRFQRLSVATAERIK